MFIIFITHKLERQFFINVKIYVEIVAAVSKTAGVLEDSSIRVTRLEYNCLAQDIPASGVIKRYVKAEPSGAKKVSNLKEGFHTNKGMLLLVTETVETYEELRFAVDSRSGPVIGGCLLRIAIIACDCPRPRRRPRRAYTVIITARYFKNSRGSRDIGRCPPRPAPAPAPPRSINIWKRFSASPI
ncbi:hypothetical protein EVAR_102426_1 [Eumeta japonica]|uniref:Uncharacterized protein n=1 Tax=Eumeta variegata TaxID=151549 RepID=A0A4C1YW17_EUMVA|nr:hypothetical protein EVAR_102426_1 [Eumeta japonica]